MTEWIPSQATTTAPRWGGRSSPVTLLLKSATAPLVSCSNPTHFQPARTRSSPSRRRTASRSTAWRSPRCTEYCGQSYPAARPSASRKMSWPNRLKKTASRVSTATRDSSVSSPSRASSFIA